MVAEGVVLMPGSRKIEHEETSFMMLFEAVPTPPVSP